MKKFITLCIATLFISTIANSQSEYYFSESDQFNTAITTPADFFGHEVGDFHIRYDKIVEYMKYLSSASDRVAFEVFGETVERRPQIMLTITSPGNHDNLESIRTEHLKLSDPSYSGNINKQTPVIIQLGFNVHGNETSGGEASILAAYFYAAATGAEIDNILANSVIFIEPVLNPDGRDRFTTWVNMNQSRFASADGNDREHNEAWPGGRTNHYWFDLNRDWLPLVQQESKHRMFRYHKWRPNLITDHHEMGSNSSFFFEPTKPGSENPIVTMENYNKLNNLFAGEYSKALDKINHYYDAGLSFDNSYPGYGSSYADVNGGLAILFEQASTRGLVQKTDLGYEMHYSLGIRNQFTGAITSVTTAVNNREMLNDYMHRFYRDAYNESKTDRYRAYVFGDSEDRGRTNDFVNLLRMHKIDVYKVKDEIKIDGKNFDPNSTYLVPTSQAQYKMVRTMFEANHKFNDSLFYDATAWAMIYSYGLPFSGLTKLPELGEPVTSVDRTVRDFELSEYGYIFKWSEYYSAKVLKLLNDEGIRVKAAWEPVSLDSGDEMVTFGRGSVFIPVQYQEMDYLVLFQKLTMISRSTGIDIFPVNTSKSAKGPWVGNGSFRSLEKPEAIMLTGDGVSSSSAGTIWHLFDTRVGLTVTKSDISRLGRIDLNDYNTLILPSGSYSDIDKSTTQRIVTWVRNGGRIIAVGSAMSWLKSNELITYETNSPKQEEARRIDYNISRQESGKHSIGGIFCSADLDITHPLGFGYNNRTITVYKNNRTFVKQVKSATSNIVVYNHNPVVSGFVSDLNRELFDGCSSLLHFRAGSGSVTLFIDDPVFRGAWMGTDKMLINALFFGGNL